MNADLRLNPNAYLPLRDVVFITLRDAILKGDLQPGERLMEISLAKQLGVSRTPIREAIRMLEKEGLAVTEPRRGARVAGMTEKDLNDVLEVRDALDELTVKDACERMTDEDFEKLEKALSEFKIKVSEKKIKEIVEADEAFHNVLYEAARNPKLFDIVQNLKEQMYRYRFEYVKELSDYSTLISEHEQIIDGLRNKDKDMVVSIMHEHLRNQVESVRKSIIEKKG